MSATGLMAETLVARLTVHSDCRLRCAFGVFGSVALPDKLSIASTATLRARRNGHGHSTRTWLPVRTGYATQPVDLNDSQLSPTTIAAGQPVNLAPTNAHPPLPNAEGEVPLQRLVSRRKRRSRDRVPRPTHTLRAPRVATGQPRPSVSAHTAVPPPPSRTPAGLRAAIDMFR